MDVKTVCLGMLTSGEASGYDLKKYFESSFGHFFVAGYGSIYPALSSLAESGLVTCRDIPQEGRPDRKVYRITKAGRQELMRALENPRPGHKVRSEFLAMLWFAHLMSAEQINAVIDYRLEEVDKFLRMLDELGDCDEQEECTGANFVAGFGRAIATACKKYLEENRQQLVAGETKALKTATG